MADTHPPPAASPPQLQTLFANTPLAEQASRWDHLYQSSHTPWDRAGPSLALADVLTQRRDLVPPVDSSDTSRRPTALVPGCGPGHDVLLLSSFGYDVWGLDISLGAFALAQQNQLAAERDGRYAPGDGIAKPGRIQWLTADFFDNAWSEGIGTCGEGTFDLVFDYTVMAPWSLCLGLSSRSRPRFACSTTNPLCQFLCALPVAARPQWAKRMSSLVRPRGRLICLEYPSNKPLLEPGPPWPLRPEVYEELLAAPGQAPSYHADGSIVCSVNTKPCDGALHRLGIIKPERTHPAGTAPNGYVIDFISVWAPS
ncbi:hypothetical protein CDD82_6139 [Ophiocordyceps australis]|uniref:Methyltransferase domain-containing protein n=1 Tax=Ophiocordyceps australis TaxID=1399860 RepID=A0A2C5YZ14_9HYPO|nr:hypothetical protein CDD82_6139 [Ophiocordyceps australis]